MCTSCLFIYLYRTIQRRVDFFFVKDHLPKCFINLHFKDEQSIDLLNSSGDKIKRDKYIKTIEESFKIYWRLLECSKLTGLNSILDYSSDLNESDETQSDYEIVESKCRDSSKMIDELSQVSLMDADTWHDSTTRICTRNLFDLKLNKTRNGDVGGLRRATKKLARDGKNAQAKISFKITFLVVALFSFFTVIFIYFKYYRLKKPCIDMQWRKKNSFQRLENPSQIR